MNELQAKFLIGTMAAFFFLSYAIPAYREMQRNHDQVVKMVGTPYVDPTPTPAK